MQNFVSQNQLRKINSDQQVDFVNEMKRRMFLVDKISGNLSIIYATS